MGRLGAQGYHCGACILDFLFSGYKLWIWKLMKLCSVARLYLVCQIRDGKSDFFRHNNCTGLRLLIDFLEPNGESWVLVLFVR